MNPYFLVLMLILFLNGCAEGHYGPQDNLDFYRISQLTELTGVYKNEGNDGNKNLNFHHYLSEDIWGYKSNWGVTSENLPTGVHHKYIEYIEVSSTENTLTAKAIQNGCVVYEKTYIVGQDFELKNGQLVIQKNTHLLSKGPQDIVIGPSYQEISIGIDTGKQGKVRSTLSQVGLVYMVFPIAGTETRDVRFERISDKPQGFKTCESR